jgi:hypothetical protein
MATELRRIFLSAQELRDAAHSYLRVNVELVGSVTVTAVQAGKDETLSVRFVRPNQPGKPKGDIVLQRDQAVDVLVRFCHENNIPLPRRGLKSVVANGDSVALQIKLAELEAVMTA